MNKADSALTTEATTIQNESTAGANTANRVGNMLNDVIDSKINNDKISTNTSLGTDDTLVPSQKAVKAYVDNSSGYKSLTGFVNTGSPSVQAMKNTIGSLAVTGPSVGVIRFTITGAFTGNKTWANYSTGYDGTTFYTAVPTVFSTDHVDFKLFNADGSPVTGSTPNVSIFFDIRVYP